MPCIGSLLLEDGQLHGKAGNEWIPLTFDEAELQRQQWALSLKVRGDLRQCHHLDGIGALCFSGIENFVGLAGEVPREAFGDDLAYAYVLLLIDGHALLLHIGGHCPKTTPVFVAELIDDGLADSADIWLRGATTCTEDAGDPG